MNQMERTSGAHLTRVAKPTKNDRPGHTRDFRPNRWRQRRHPACCVRHCPAWWPESQSLARIGMIGAPR